MSDVYDESELIERYESKIPIIHILFGKKMIAGTLFRFGRNSVEINDAFYISVRTLSDHLPDYIRLLSNNNFATILLNEELFIKSVDVYRYEIHDIDYVEGSCIITIDYTIKEVK